MQIVTEFWAKPIPLRQFDWSAVTDNYEPGHPIGFGRTRQEAIEDLLEQEEERAPDWLEQARREFARRYHEENGDDYENSPHVYGE